MSSPINLNQAALYGFITEWGDSAFAGGINVGNWGNNQGRFAQNYNYQTTTTNTWGDKNYHSHSGTAYPYSTLNAGQAEVNGGTAQGGLAVSNSQWSSASTSNFYPYLNLYNLLAPQSGSGSDTSSTLSVVTPFDYNVIGAPGASYTGNDRSYTSYGQPTFAVTNGVNSSYVTYQADSTNSLTISEGQITTSTQQLASGVNLNQTFTFFPNTSQPFAISTTFTESIRSSDTQGTSDSQSTSGSNSATLGITATETGSVGEDQANYMSASLQESYNETWETAWGNTSTADFSSTNAISSTSSFTLSTTENLEGAIVTGYSTTANGQKTPLYQYTTVYTNPITGQQTTSVFDLVAGAQYQWEVQYYSGTIQNIVSGQYTLSGNAGQIADSTSNAFGGNIAQAFYYANQGNAWDALGYGYNPVKSFNSTDPDDITSVEINGSTVSSTSESVNVLISLVYVGPGTYSSNTNASSLMLPGDSDNDSARIQGKWYKMEDNLILLPQNTVNPTGYNGDNSRVFLRDTLGQDLIRTEGGRDHVFLRGNILQANNPGDIAYLGAGNDIADSRKAQGTNTVIAETGDDQILDGAANLMSNLGAGNDTYIYGGGYDMITLGDGSDHLQLKRGSGGVTVGDFQVGEDLITGLGKNARLVWDQSLAAFTINNSNRITGRLFTSLSATSAQDPEFWYGLALQNTDQLKLDQAGWNGESWQDVRSRYGRYGYQTNLKTEDWTQFSSNRENLNEAAEFIALSAGHSTLTRKQLSEINHIAGASESFIDFIAGTTGYIANLQ